MDSYFKPNRREECPEGWHLPSDAEWKQLEMALGMTQDQADATGWRGTDQSTQMKPTNGWASDGNGTNTSGFSAFPGGYRYNYDGTFYNVGYSGHWWSRTESNSSYTWSRVLNYASVYRYYYNKAYGLSVRYVRD